MRAGPEIPIHPKEPQIFAKRVVNQIFHPSKNHLLTMGVAASPANKPSAQAVLRQITQAATHDRHPLKAGDTVKSAAANKTIARK